MVDAPCMMPKKINEKDEESVIIMERNQGQVGKDVVFFRRKGSNSGC